MTASSPGTPAVAVRPPARPARKPAPPGGPLRALVHILGSFGLAVVLFLFLLVLTLVGTLEQAFMSLFDVQETYFASFFVVHRFGSFPVLLPGAYLLLSLLLVNLVVGGIIRLRYGVRTLGVLIAHIGIIMLLVGSFVERQWSTKGFMRLYEGEQADAYQSHHEWEVAVVGPAAEGSGVREWVIPESAFGGLGDGAFARFTAPELPFVVQIDGYARNSEAQRVGAGQGGAGQGGGVDGYVLRAKPPVTDSDGRNVPGMRVTLIDKQDESARHRGLLWGYQNLPFAARVAGRTYGVDLRPRRWHLPFSLRLREFEMETYPGISMAKRYSSYVTKRQGDVEQEVHITMNEPMRHRHGPVWGGYVLYQSGYGPEGAPPGTRMYSVFQVVDNPSDLMPLISCIVIGLGLLFQFGRKLVLYLASASRRAA